MTIKQSIKEWFIWHWPNRKTVTGWSFIIFLFALLALLIHGNPFEASMNLKRYKGIADDAVIVNIKRTEYLSQDETGNKIRTLGFNLEYTYYVKEELFYGTHFLNTSVTHSKKLDDILNGNYEIRYMLFNPEKSTITQKQNASNNKD